MISLEKFGVIDEYYAIGLPAALIRVSLKQNDKKK